MSADESRPRLVAVQARQSRDGWRIEVFSDDGRCLASEWVGHRPTRKDKLALARRVFGPDAKLYGG